MTCFLGAPKKFYKKSTVPKNNPLEGINVLVTRPEGQSEHLCSLIEQSGGRAIAFPVLEIKDIADSSHLAKQIESLHTFDIAIFISANAVKKAVNQIFAQRTWPKSTKIAAVGKTSAKALDSLGLIADIFPSTKFNSEALLAMPQLENVSEKRIIIFRGEGGREHLAETLKARGATVEYAECYKRCKPKTDASKLLKLWARGEIHIIVTTSNEGLRNLYDMVGQVGRQWLIKSPMVVISDRAADFAMQLGFKSKPVVSNQANDEAILNSLIAWSNIQNH